MTTSSRMSLSAPSELPRAGGRRALVALVAVLTAGAALRLIDLDRHGLWVDEGYTARLTELPVTMYYEEMRSDTAPPLYYYLSRPAALLAPWNVFALRLLPAVCGILSILLVYLLATELFGNRWSGVTAAALLAAARHHVVHSQEARNYTLYFLLALVAMCCAARLARRPIVDSSRVRKALWGAFVLAGVGVVYTHNIGWFCLAGILLFYPIACFVRGERRGGLLGYVPALETILVGLFVLALFLPWLPTFLFQARHVMHDYWIARPTVARVLDAMVRLVWLPPNVPAEFGSDLLPYTLGLAAAGAIWSAGILGGLFWLLRGSDQRASALTACLTLAVLAVVGVSLIAQPVFMEKVVIFYMVAPLLGVAAIPAIPWRPPVRALARRLSLGIALFALTAAVANHGLQYGEQWREATAYVLARAQPQREPIVVDSGFHLMTVAWYVHDTPYGPVDWSRPDCTVLAHRGNPSDLFASRNEVQPSQVARLRQLLRPGGYVWLIQRGHGDQNVDESVLKFLKSIGPMVDKKDLLGVTVRAYRVDRLPATQPDTGKE